MAELVKDLACIDEFCFDFRFDIERKGLTGRALEISILGEEYFGIRRPRALIRRGGLQWHSAVAGRAVDQKSNNEQGRQQNPADDPLLSVLAATAPAFNLLAFGDFSFLCHIQNLLSF